MISRPAGSELGRSSLECTVRPLWYPVFIFCGMLTLLTFFAYYTNTGEKVQSAATTGVAMLLYHALGGVGTPVIRDGPVIHGIGFSLQLETSCNGLLALMVIVSVLMAARLSVRLRFSIALFALPAAVLLNVIRLMTVFWMGLLDRRAAWFAHEVGWPILYLLIGIMVFWVLGGKLRGQDDAHGERHAVR